MFQRLVLVFVLVPIVELILLIQMGRWVGLWPTLGLIAVTGIVGAALARREGLRAWRAFQREASEGKMPGRPILDGLCIFAGGALLLTPGLMTDLLGFGLVLRPTRRWLQDRVVGRLGGALLRHGRVYVQAPLRRTGPVERSGGEGERPAGRRIER